MARKKTKEDKKEKSKKESGDLESTESYLKEETVRAIVAVGFFVLAVFLLMSAFNKGGFVGLKSYEIFTYLFGIGYYLLPTIFFILCVSFFRSLHKKLALTHSIGGVLFFISSLSLVNISMPSRGGVVGGFISEPLVGMFDTYATVLILIALAVISILVIFDAPLNFAFLSSLFKKKETEEGTEDAGPALLITNNGVVEDPKSIKESAQQAAEEKPGVLKKMLGGEEKKDEFGISPLLLNGKDFIPPPLSLLEKDKGKPGVGDIKAN